MLARHGFTVFGGVRRGEDGEVLERDARGDVRALRLDVTDEEQVGRAAEIVDQAVGEAGLAGLVNNAGVAIGGPVESIPLDDLRRQLEVNLIGQVGVTQAFLPALRRARGRIVNMSSVGGRVASPFFGPYNASKFGLEAISDALRIELRPWGIDVSVIEPGSVATDIWDRGAATARAVRARMGDGSEALYGEALDAMGTAAAKMGKEGLHPDRVAKAIAHALTARRPKSRYLIGREARLMVGASNVLPTRVYDAVVERTVGLPRKPPSSD